jgi:uncharacterized protein YerC
MVQTAGQAQTVRDREAIARRKERLSEFEQMRQFLSAWDKAQLLLEAKTYYQQTIEAGSPVAQVGRVEKRRLDALTCWFCENHKEVLLRQFAIGDMMQRQKKGMMQWLPSQPSQANVSEWIIPDVTDEWECVDPFDEQGWPLD